MSEGGGGGYPGVGQTGGGGGKGGEGGGFAGTGLAEGPTGAPTAGTVGEGIGGARTPMIPILGGAFGGGETGGIGEIGGFGGDPTGGGQAAGGPTATIANPLGMTTARAPTATGAGAISAPTGFGGDPTDLTGFGGGQGMAFDPSQGAAATGAPAGTTPATGLSPEQMGKAAPTAAAPAAAGGGTKSVLESLGIKSPLGAAIGAAGLGYSMMQGQQAPKFSPELQAQAARLDANGQKLMAYLQEGNLPPGLKASLDQATAGAKAKIISNFAAQGLNTDPTQNSVLAQQLAQVDQQAIISTAQMGQQLMQSGLAQSGLSSDLYKTLANIDQTQTANIGKAISAFAASLGGVGRGVNLKLG